MKNIVLARPMPAAVTDFARRHFAPFVPDRVLSESEVIEVMSERQAQALVFGANLKVDAALVAALPDTVRVVATTSVGFDHVDVAALKARNIAAAYVPHAVTQCTADITFMLLLCAARRAKEYEAVTRNGWGRKFAFDEMLGTRVSGKRIGIVGMGRIGRAVAKRAAGFDMDVLYHDLAEITVDEGSHYTFYPSLDDMLPHCDFISLHAPGSKSGPLMDERAIAKLPKGAVLVNAARGSLVDEDALIRALESGHLGAAGLDTFMNEPNINVRLTNLPNVFSTPHMGTATIETRVEMGIRALENVKNVLEGAAPLDPLWS